MALGQVHHIKPNRRQDIANSHHLRGTFRCARSAHHGHISSNHSCVLDKYRIWAVIGGRNFDDAPPSLAEDLDILLPLRLCECEVDRRAVDMGYQPFSQAWARASDNGDSRGDHPRSMPDG